MIDINSLSPIERIEFQLGKDRYPNLFFYPHIPEAWEIEINDKYFTGNLNWRDCKNLTYEHDGVEYKFNNLGYRCHYDYHIEDLKNKKNILCVGDSDIFGPYKSYDLLWTSILQKRLPEYNIINLGMPGWAADTVTRTTMCTLKALGTAVHHVCVIWPLECRREIVSKIYNKIVARPNITDLPSENYWDTIDWINNNYNFYKNREFLDSACKAQSVDFIDLLLVTVGKNKRFDGERFGQGVLGPITHEALANWFQRRIEGKPSLYQELRKK